MPPYASFPHPIDFALLPIVGRVVCTQGKIIGSKRIQDLNFRALAIDPDNATINHIMGVSDNSWKTSTGRSWIGYPIAFLHGRYSLWPPLPSIWLLFLKHVSKSASVPGVPFVASYLPEFPEYQQISEKCLNVALWHI